MLCQSFPTELNADYGKCRKLRSLLRDRPCLPSDFDAARRVVTNAKRVELLVSESVAGFHYARRVPKVSGSRSNVQKA